MGVGNQKVCEVKQTDSLDSKDVVRSVYRVHFGFL